MSNSDTQTENFLELELDGGTNFGDLDGKIFAVGDGRREFSSYRRYEPGNVIK